MSEVSWPDQRNGRVSLIGSLRVREFIGLWSLIKRLCFDIRAGIWNFPTHTDFPGLSGFGFLNVRLAIFSFTCLRTKIICHRVYGRLVQQLFVHAICHSDLFLSFYNDCAQSKEKDFNVFLFFISPFLADDVIRAPDLWLAAAAPSRTCEAWLHICWAFATAHWDRMHSQESCFLHPGLYWSLEPSGFPKAVSTVPTPCTVVQTHR